MDKEYYYYYPCREDYEVGDVIKEEDVTYKVIETLNHKNLVLVEIYNEKH